MALALIRGLLQGGQLIIYGCMSGTAPSWPSSTWIFQGIRVCALPPPFNNGASAIARQTLHSLHQEPLDEDGLKQLEKCSGIMRQGRASRSLLFTELNAMMPCMSPIRKLRYRPCHGGQSKCMCFQSPIPPGLTAEHGMRGGQ